MKRLLALMTVIAMLAMTTSVFAAGSGTSSGDTTPDEDITVQELSDGTTVVTVDEDAITDDVVELPIEIEAEDTVEAADPIEIIVPDNAGEVAVEIPVTDLTPGVVAYVLNEDGSYEIIKTTLTSENGIVITVSGSTTIKVVDNTKEFNDVDGLADWADEAIDFVTSREIFIGNGDGTFAPEDNMTRGMLFTVLARFDGADVTTEGANWYAESMNWAVAQGLTDGTYPEEDITREQVATLLYRYAGKPAADGDLSAYADADSISTWAVDAVKWAVKEGILNGAGGNILPQETATRAQVAAFMQRYCANVA